MPPSSAEQLPVNVVTGFLGSGKTTLLASLLATEAFGETAVLVNEFGEVGLDHLLLDAVAPNTVLLKSGCVCCMIRGELSEALRNLYSRRERGEVPPFSRVVLETTGLANPSPIASTLSADPVVRHHFQPAMTITVVDAVNALELHDSEQVWAQQVAAADLLALSKTDLVGTDRTGVVRQLLRRLNPVAQMVDTASLPALPDKVLGQGIHLSQESDVVRRWLPVPSNRDELPTSISSLDETSGAQHLHNIESCCITFQQPIDWTAFGVWLSLLLNQHGSDVLRVKGLLQLTEVDGPIAIHGVQHTIYPPVHLPEWPNEDKLSQVVFITRGIDRSTLMSSLEGFLRSLTPSAIDPERPLLT